MITTTDTRTSLDLDKNFWDAYYILQVATLQCQSAIGLNLLENAADHLAAERKERS